MFPAMHGSQESCTITMLHGVSLIPDSLFVLRSCCENLMIDGLPIESVEDFPDTLAAGKSISWSTTAIGVGWKICFVSTDPDFDGKKKIDKYFFFTWEGSVNEITTDSGKDVFQKYY